MFNERERSVHFYENVKCFKFISLLDLQFRELSSFYVNYVKAFQYFALWLLRFLTIECKLPVGKITVFLDLFWEKLNVKLNKYMILRFSWEL